MRISYPFCLLLVSCLASVAQAQMFATVEECDQLFGEPISPTERADDVRFYRHDGVTIKILFVEKKAAVVTYNSLTSLKIDDEKQQKLLASNAGGQTWSEVEGEGAKTWQRSDGQAFAIYDNANGELNVFSTVYIEKARAEVQNAIGSQ